MKKTIVGLLVLCLVGMLVAEPGKKRQEHHIGLEGGHQIIIQYNTKNNENIVYGTGQHILLLKEALALLESIAASTKQKDR